MPVKNDFEGINKISRKKLGVYVLWGKDNECLYVGSGKIISRISSHLSASEFKDLIVAITVYIGQSNRETSLLEYALIHRYSPVYNKELRWNNIVGLKYKGWGEKFFLKKERI